MVKISVKRSARSAAPANGHARLSARLRTAREEQGLTWYAVAKRAGIPNPNTVRDIEHGRDAQLSSIRAVAKVLGMRLELVAECA